MRTLVLRVTVVLATLISILLPTVAWAAAPAVTTDSSGTITATSVTLTGTLTSMGTAAAADVYFKYGTAARSGSPPAYSTGAGQTAPVPVTATGAFSANVTGLTPGTIYYFTAYADGITYGLGYGGELSFTTPTGPAVTTVAASGIGRTAATLNGDLTAMPAAGGTVNLNFLYATVPGGPYATVAADTPGASTAGPAPVSFSVTLALAANTTYYFKAQADAGVEGVADGAEMSFSTLTEPVVATNNATAIVGGTGSDGSATLNGILTYLNGAASVGVSFEWDTDAPGAPYANAAAGVPSPLTAPGLFSADLTGLTAGATVYFRAVADAGGGLVAYGSEKSFTVANKPQVTTLNATNIKGTTPRAATLQGRLDGLGTASSVTLWFGYATAHGGPYTWVAATPASTSGPAPVSFTANISGFGTGTYYVVAKAVGDGEGIGNEAVFGLSHIYYEAMKIRYSLHNTRLETMADSAARTNNCITCHVSNDTADPNLPLNPYGSDLVNALDGSITGASAGTPDAFVEESNGTLYTTDPVVIETAMALVESKDSDGDGTSNKNELWMLTLPGDPNDEAVEEPSTEALGPHGNYGETPDLCASCHRFHTAEGPKLLKVDQYDLCTSCHDGTGARTNVVDGILQAAPSNPASGSGPLLKGGGFVNAAMDTNLDGTAAMASVTSTHTVDGTEATMWGYGTSAWGAGKPHVALQCGDCHDPHNPTWTPDGGTTTYQQYRMLRLSPYVASNPRGFMLMVPDEAGDHQYAQPVDGTTHRPVTTYQTTDRIGEFCAECHTRYQAVTISLAHVNTVGETARPGDPIFTYQHATKEAACSVGRCHVGSAFSRPRCVDCHVSHGTTATMGVYSASVPWPGGVEPGGFNQPAEGNSRSSLLRTDNRGVCTSCHEK